MTTSIRLRGVTKRFGGPDPNTTPAVDGIDLDIDRGEVVALLGPNGAGKTTTLDMILGFQPPTEGRVEVFGLAPTEAVRAGRVSAVLQTGGLLRDLRVGETVELVASTFPDPPSVDDVLARAGIEGIARRMVQQCSGGEQQRLRFALALLAEPDLLILDEPTSGMDPTARSAFWEAMAAEAAKGRTVVFATHYLEEAEAFAPRTVLVARGRVVADGPTDRIRAQVGGRVVRATVPTDRVSEVAAALSRQPQVSGVETDGDRLVVSTANADDVARYLLGSAGGRDLEIDAPSLERAFHALTGDLAPESGPASAVSIDTDPDHLTSTGGPR